MTKDLAIQIANKGIKNAKIRGIMEKSNVFAKFVDYLLI